MRGLLRISLILSLCLAYTHAGRTEDTWDPEDPAESEQLDAVEDVPSQQLAPEVERELATFAEPSLSETEQKEILAKYAYLDPQKLVPPAMLSRAILYFAANETKLPNKKYITVMDYGPHSREHRLFIIDMKDGSVLRLHAAHGTGSDEGRTGYARKFSNSSGANMSSLGWVRTAETYDGKHGYSLRLDGLSSTNSNLRNRAVVIHGAQYVWEQNVKQGRSWGCIAVSMKAYKLVIDKLKGGSLILAGRSY